MTGHPLRRLRTIVDESTRPVIHADRADVAVAIRMVDRFADRWIDEAGRHAATAADLEATRARLDQLVEDLAEAERVATALTDYLLDAGDRAGLVAVLRQLRSEAAT